ncbi:hypothetical protein VNO80_02840 [Phaseolus coccineus]|uniref:Uncharacterized protein n=1 Tax=Phaseolus coccineus TaxID=3886 RepID=A0AAN9NQE0_PHACN
MSHMCLMTCVRRSSSSSDPLFPYQDVMAHENGISEGKKLHAPKEAHKKKHHAPKKAQKLCRRLRLAVSLQPSASCATAAVAWFILLRLLRRVSQLSRRPPIVVFNSIKQSHPRHPSQWLNFPGPVAFLHSDLEDCHSELNATAQDEHKTAGE